MANEASIQSELEPRRELHERTGLRLMVRHKWQLVANPDVVGARQRTVGEVLIRSNGEELDIGAKRRTRVRVVRVPGEAVLEGDTLQAELNAFTPGAAQVREEAGQHGLGGSNEEDLVTDVRPVNRCARDR